MEFVVVRFDWELILAIVLILNDGNIYGTKKSYFWNTFLYFWKLKSHPTKGSIPFGRVVTQYCELRAEVTCIEQPAVAALQCI